MKTDAQILQDVIAELQWEPSVQAAQIGVEVNKGVVTLAGHVDSFSQKWHAERAAQRVAGVRALVVGLEVRLTGLSERTDADIAQAAQNVLQWTSLVPADAIKVMVEHGWVTLTGDVDWQFQRQAATDGVRHLMGVTGVSNQIKIKAARVVSSVKSDIEAALQRSSIADASNIDVALDGSVVTLSGTIQRWDERDTAIYSAWGTPGVYNVIDEMTLEA